MKKLLSLILILTLAASFSACAKDSTADTTTSPADALLSDGEVNTGMKEKFDQMEYASYVDLFYNSNGSAYEGKSFTKDGTFAILEDAYNNVTRYYVWGYADNTKCCDYQWEIVLDEGIEIPEAGSYVKVKGTMEKNAAALDGYWLTGVTLEVKEGFSNAGFDIDMTTMSPTLVRVEIINMLNFPAIFSGKSIRVFGRALTPTSIQHPYYNESWSMDFTAADTVPAIGEYILLEGIYNNSIINTQALTVIG